ncbi:hypothetical protein [Gordonia humi]|uniref:Low molecular weight antigen MTB12-like C-terminal domain-containing protein n=1 Tax=Gordonia humi TaxID=686429 RepID=A0A840F9N2_9ACTN|nr:hypothetical protein [Gordonia humi]
MKIRNFVTGAVVAAAVAATAACGSDDGSNDLPPVPTADSSTTSAAADSSAAADADPLTDAKKVPNVAALNEMLDTALDPKVKAADKTDLVEGSEVDPALFNQLVKAVKDNPDVTYKIKPPVTKNGPNKAKVKVEVKLPDNPPTKIDAAIVFDNGRWKLSKSTVCPLLQANDVKSKLCADSSATETTSKKKAG